MKDANIDNAAVSNAEFYLSKPWFSQGLRISCLSLNLYIIRQQVLLAMVSTNAPSLHGLTSAR